MYEETINTPATSQRALSIRGESVERIYGFFRERRFLVNRRYQRKLVWTIEEKQAFIDSLRNGYPVPLILLAEAVVDDEKRYEVIDGMQRLNAIASFVEGRYALLGYYFDLDAMALTKELTDTRKFKQRTPKLERSICTRIASYQIPLSIYELTEHQEVDEVFRRINSYGRQLSRQDLRQAGALGNFSDLVRRLSSTIRGDVSASDRLYLNEMDRISISGKELEYGIDVDSIFWVQQNILTRDYIRQSRDEELIADMLAFILLDPKPESSSELLNRLYTEPSPTTGVGKNRFQEIEEETLKHGPEIVFDNFLLVFDEFRRIVSHANKPFNRLMFREAGVRVPRYFQAVFLALWDLMINRNQKIDDRAKVAGALDGIGGKSLNVGGGGGRWGAEERQRNVNAVVGVIQPFFSEADVEDPAHGSWVIKLETILRQSYTEQNLYDFKQGFHDLAAPYEFNGELFSKCIETLCAMSNKGSGAVGYVIVGVADREETANRLRDVHGLESRRLDEFYVTGIDHEAKHHSGIDRYFQSIVAKIKDEPAPDWAKEYIAREVRLVKYFGRSVLVMKLAAGPEPAHYNGAFKVRHGANNELVDAAGYGRLFARFQ